MYNTLTKFVAFNLKEKRKNTQKCQKCKNNENVSRVEIWKIISLLHYKFISSQPWYFFSVFIFFRVIRKNLEHQKSEMNGTEPIKSKKVILSRKK